MTFRYFIKKAGPDIAFLPNPGTARIWKILDIDTDTITVQRIDGHTTVVPYDFFMRTWKLKADDASRENFMNSLIASTPKYLINDMVYENCYFWSIR